MAISRAEKEARVKQYVEQLQNSQAIIIADYTGLKVSELEQLRTKIREVDGSFSVVKNTLAKRALQEVGYPEIDDLLTGPVGIGFSGDNVPAVAKAFVDFAKEHEMLKIKGGVMSGKVLSAEAIKDLASLPSLEVLRAQLLGLINAPASRLVGALSGGVRQLVSVINAYAEKGSEASAEA
ncbi:MAG: 50S ribosomal protein L10 [Chloroflexi bacterium]|nr:MAG: 50S ribosomal protein L10 [Chloroflexota bacterium]